MFENTFVVIAQWPVFNVNNHCAYSIIVCVGTGRQHKLCIIVQDILQAMEVVLVSM